VLKGSRSIGGGLESVSAADPGRVLVPANMEFPHPLVGRHTITATNLPGSSAVYKTAIHQTAPLIESGVSITDNQTQN